MKDLPVENGDSVLLAVSGGGDSMGMLALFLSALPRPDVKLTVAHVHHNLRGEEADRDMDFVKDVASSLGLPFRLIKLKGSPRKGQSVEEWARRGRYEALLKSAEKEGCRWIATAHNMNDQAETLLMRIYRGSGLDGLAGILHVSGSVMRPVLGFTGEELREAAEGAGLKWIEDSTNRDRRFLRNRIRLDVIPALECSLPGFAEKLAVLGRLASEATGNFDASRFVTIRGDGLYYSCNELAGLTDGEGTEVFRAGLRLRRENLRRITERHLRALWSLRIARKGAKISLPGGWMGIRGKDGIEVRPETSRGSEGDE